MEFSLLCTVTHNSLRSSFESSGLGEPETDLAKACSNKRLLFVSLPSVWQLYKMMVHFMLYNGLSALTVGSEAIYLLDFTVTAKVAVK